MCRPCLAKVIVNVEYNDCNRYIDIYAIAKSHV